MKTKRIINETESLGAVNSIGSSSSVSGPIQTYDPILLKGVLTRKKKILSLLQYTKKYMHK